MRCCASASASSMAGAAASSTTYAGGPPFAGLGPAGPPLPRACKARAELAVLDGFVAPARRLGPTLPRALAGASRVELGAVAERVRQLRIRAAVDRRGLRNLLARVAMRIEDHFSGGAKALARLFVGGEA